MQWDRKAQIAWFAVFSVVFLTLVWTVIPVVALRAEGGAVFALDRVIYTAVALVLAALLGTAAGAETDYSSALTRFGLAAEASPNRNRQIMSWVRIFAIFFILLPFALLGFEIEGHFKALALTHDVLAQHLSESGISAFTLLYDSLYGLCLTLLAIDFFMAPLSAQIMRDEAMFSSKDRLLAHTVEVCSKFLGAMKMIAEQNVPTLRGTPGIWSTLTGIVNELEVTKKSAVLLSIDPALKEKLAAHLTDLQAAMQELMPFVSFLSRFDAGRVTAGRRQFKNACKLDIQDSLGALQERVDELYADFELSLPLNSRQALEKLRSGLGMDWATLRAAGAQHYGITNKPSTQAVGGVAVTPVLAAAAR